MRPKVIAIGGGKGGTGKSIIAVQLGILLSKLDLRVVIVDIDNHGANLHTFLGFDDPKSTIDKVFARECLLEEAILPTGFKNLGLVPGFSFDLPIPFSNENKLLFEEQLANIAADIVVLDVGTGIFPWTLNMFEIADAGVLVGTPEPTSVEKNYKFLRALCRLRVAQRTEGEAFPKSGWLPVPWLSSLKRKNEDMAIESQKILRAKPLGILINQLKQVEQKELSSELCAVFKRFFGVQALDLGWLSYDERITLSVQNKCPIVFDYPHARWTEQMHDLTDRIYHLLGEEVE